ncbi:MAG: hypothetical protein OEW37_11510, partial [Rhodospirillaceae bacterium]|nr:hypothetical protein [Rhodospirillaceae bacterium]
MVKIANYAANQQLNRYLAQIQSRTHDLQVQISSGKRAQSYTKISIDSQFLVSMENSRDLLEKFGENNSTMDFRMQVTETTVTSIEKTIEEFLSTLTNKGLTSVPSESEVADIQKWAFDSMISIEGLLNSTADGRYIYGGSRNLSQPVDLGLKTLSEFQAKYDGFNVTYPTTRDAHLTDFSQDKNAASGVVNWLQFDNNSPANDRITAASNEFSHVVVGSTITIANTVNNNGTFTVTGVDAGGTWVEVGPGLLTNEGTADFTHTGTGTVSFTDNAPALDTISDVAGTFSRLTPGATITISGSTGDPLNNGVYTIASVSGDGSTITVNENVNSTQALDAGTVLVTAPIGTEFFTHTNTVFDHTSANTVSFTNNVFPVLDTISDAIGTFSGLAPGTSITVSGSTDPANDGVYTIASVSGDGSTITVNENINSTQLLDAGTVSVRQGTVSFTDNVLPALDTISDAPGTFSGLTAGMSIDVSG